MSKKNESILCREIGEEVEENNASFLAKIAHELKSPAHGISGISDFLDENWNILDDSVRRKCVADISKASSILNELIEFFLRLSKENSKKMKFIFRKADILQLVQEAIDQNINLSTMNNNVTIKIDCSSNQCQTMMDPFWFRQLMINLIANAIKYAQKGVITVRVDLESDCYVIAVCDQGKGIPESELGNIFKEYNQGGRANKSGVGLGLAICKEIVDAHEGEIWAQNNDDVGATIKFTIPLKKS